MLKKQPEKTIVWIARSRQTEAEKDVISKLGQVEVMNAQFFSTQSSENVHPTRVYNLSGRKDIDEFYDSVLVKEPVVIPASVVTESEDAEPIKTATVKVKAAKPAV